MCLAKTPFMHGSYYPRSWSFQLNSSLKCTFPYIPQITNNLRLTNVLRVALTLAAHCRAKVLAHALSFSCCSNESPNLTAVVCDIAAAATGPVASVGVNRSYLMKERVDLNRFKNKCFYFNATLEESRHQKWLDTFLKNLSYIFKSI